MAAEQVEAEPDRLSALPFEILLHISSFLPTKFAIRASVLSRRFRLLWASSPSIDLDFSDFRRRHDFVHWTHRCFARLRRRKSPLVSFSLKVDNYNYSVHIKSLSVWLLAAHSKGLRRLSLCLDQQTVEKILPLILSFHSLESVSIENSHRRNLYRYSNKSIVPLKFNLIHLKSLHFKAQLTCSELARLVSEQKNLQYLSYDPQLERSNKLHLSSPTVKKLELNYISINHVSEAKLLFPTLESLDLKMSFGPFEYLNVYMPLLRTARIKIPCLCENRVPCVGDWLRSLINVEELELSIDYIRPEKEINPFHPLVEEGKDLPTFPNLKRLKLSMFFHELAIQDLVCLLHNSPVLQSLQLVHRAHVIFNCSNKSRHRWISRLPVNSEGNNEHAYFDDLHVGDNKIDLATKLLQLPELKSKDINKHVNFDGLHVVHKKIEPEKTETWWGFLFYLFKWR